MRLSAELECRVSFGGGFSAHDRSNRSDPAFRTTVRAETGLT